VRDVSQHAGVLQRAGAVLRRRVAVVDRRCIYLWLPSECRRRARLRLDRGHRAWSGRSAIAGIAGSTLPPRSPSRIRASFASTDLHARGQEVPRGVEAVLNASAGRSAQL